MKNYLFRLSLQCLLGSFFVTTFSVAQSGWVTQASGTSNDLWGVCFVDSLTGTVVGANGTILHTTNEGTAWVPQSSGTTAFLYGVSFSDANNGTVVGSSGTILHTTNGGANWINQSSGTDLDLHSVSFTNVNVGTAVGGAAVDSGIVIRTENGGITWNRQRIPTTPSLWGVSFVDDTNGGAVGFFSPGGTIIHTTDSGLDWAGQSAGPYTDWLYSIHFVTRSAGMAVGEFATVIKTTNGGATWTNLSPPFTHYSGVSLMDTNNALVVGYLGIIRTTDGGTTWTSENTGGNISLKGVCTTDLFHATAVGPSGIILHTSNGGITSVRENSSLPKTYELFQNYPNPFNPSTTISFNVPLKSFVSLKIFDVLGKEVVTIISQELPAGSYSRTWYAQSLPSGLYFYRLQAGSFTGIRKLVLVK